MESESCPNTLKIAEGIRFRDSFIHPIVGTFFQGIKGEGLNWRVQDLHHEVRNVEQLLCILP